MKKIVFAFVVIFIGIENYSQQQFTPEVNAKAPRIIPAPPNASALTKYSGVDVALNTGMVKFNIPLYNLTAGQLDLPISLSYASNGVRVDEYPSLTGMSWVLNAGGVITRTVYGAFDEGAVRRTISDNYTTQQMYDFVYQYNNRTWNAGDDTEADLFSFNFCGYDGKFVLDENWNPILLPYSNLKIEINFGGSAYTFKIIDAKGIKYYFGGSSAIEETRSNNSAYSPIPGVPNPPFIKTAYYLNKIESPNGDVIYLDYNLYTHYANALSVTQTSTYINGFTSLCTPPCPSDFSSVRSFADYNSRVLSQIRVTNWGTISFSYGSYNVNVYSTTSAESYKVLTGISVTNNSNATIKVITLNYNYVETIAYPNQYAGEGGTPIKTYRPFLSEVNSGADKYQFEYYSPDQLPVITSFSQDFLGFYNGIYNQWFIPNLGGQTFYQHAEANRNPNPTYAVCGLLKKITHPTGGTDNITYEANMVSTSVVGGMRVKTLTAQDNINSTPVTRRIYYGPFNSLNSNSGWAATPWFEKTITNGTICYDQNNWPLLATCTFSQRSSSTANNLGIYNGGIIAYTSVTESIGGDNFENGGIEHQYQRSQNSYCYPIENGNLFDGPMNYSTMLHGLETYTKVFKMNGTSEVKLSETNNYYIVNDNLYLRELKSLNVVARYFPINIPDLQGFDVNKTIYTSRWEVLDHSTTITYDENGLNPLTTTKNYYYNNTHHLQPTSIQTTDSKGNPLISAFKYPEDFANPNNPNIYDDMLSRNMIAILLEKTDNRANTQFSDTRIFYRSSSFPVPDHVESKVANNSTYQELVYDTYDPTGNILQFTGKDGIVNSFIYDYYSFLPVAEVKNATQNNIAYTSFESNGQGGWSFSGSISSPSFAPTGKKAYTLTGYPISKSLLDPAKTYIVSYWSTDNNFSYTVSGTQYVRTGRNINGWKYYEHEVTGISTLNITGTGSIDEVRLYPKSSLMTTYIYDPLIGMTCQCDANNRINYYEYDAYNRLSIIRDQDKNVVKKICYNYYNQVEDCQTAVQCTNFNPDWQNVGSPYCEQGSCGNTGYQLQLQQDMNPCTNYGTRIFSTYNPTACPASNCINLTSTNNTGLDYYNASYYNTSTGITYNFSVPTISGLQLLGSVPEGNYTLTISRTQGFPLYCEFRSGCKFQIITGTSATFYNVAVSATTCNSITITAGN